MDLLGFLSLIIGHLVDLLLRVDWQVVLGVGKALACFFDIRRRPFPGGISPAFGGVAVGEDYPNQTRRVTLTKRPLKLLIGRRPMRGLEGREDAANGLYSTDRIID